VTTHTPDEESMMLTRFYRTTVVGCALAWFMVGLHLPTLHQMTEHGRRMPPSVLAAVALLAVVGVATLWALLRVPAGRRGPPGQGTAAA
jgi:hypothetical protein